MPEQFLETNNTPDTALNGPKEFDPQEFADKEQVVRRHETEARENLARAKGRREREAAERALEQAQIAIHEVDKERRALFPATISPSLLVRSRLWDATDFTDDERKEFGDMLDYGLDNSLFSSIAESMVFGDVETTDFVDYFLREHMGDPYRIGQNRPKTPDVYGEFGPYKHDYNHTLVNGYVDRTQHLIHIRETYEQGVDPKDRYLVIIGNVATREANLFRINDVEVNPNVSTRLILTTDRVDTRGGGGSPLLVPNTTESKLRRARMARDRQAAHERQTAVELSNQSIKFKAFGGQEEEVGPIGNVLRDRRVLAQLAVAAGVANYHDQPIRLPDYVRAVA